MRLIILWITSSTTILISFVKKDQETIFYTIPVYLMLLLTIILDITCSKYLFGSRNPFIIFPNLDRKLSDYVSVLKIFSSLIYLFYMYSHSTNIWKLILLQRAVKISFQNPDGAVSHIFWVSLLDMMNFKWWNEMSVELKLLLIFIASRVVKGVYGKIWFWWLTTYHFLVIKNTPKIIFIFSFSIE